MAIITIGTPFNIDLEFKIAAFQKRLAAWLIDVVIICLYFYLMLKFIHPLLEMSESVAVVSAVFIILIPVLIYQLAFEMFMNGQTVGKKVAGIKVIDKEGGEPTWGQYIIRWMLCPGNLFIYLIPIYILHEGRGMAFLLIVYLPDFLSVVISAKSQRLSDFAANTVVIDKNYKANISETIYLEIEDKSYKPIFPQVMRLTDRDINGIRNLINVKRPTRDTDTYMQQVVDKIKTVLNIETDMDPYIFLQQLLHDYNYYTTTSSAARKTE